MHVQKCSNRLVWELGSTFTLVRCPCKRTNRVLCAWNVGTYIHILRVGQNHALIGIYGVHTVFLAGTSPNIQTYTVQIYGSGQPYICIVHVLSRFVILVHKMGSRDLYSMLGCVHTSIRGRAHTYVRICANVCRHVSMCTQQRRHVSMSKHCVGTLVCEHTV